MDDKQFFIYILHLTLWSPRIFDEVFLTASLWRSVLNCKPLTQCS